MSAWKWEWIDPKGCPRSVWILERVRDVFGRVRVWMGVMSHGDVVLEGSRFWE